MLGRIRRIIKHPFSFLINLGGMGFFNWMSDEQYLRIAYYAMLNKKLDLENPKTYNEKLQWLKLYDHSPQYIKMVDKYAVKDYVAGVIGAEYVVPTLGVWEKFEDIDFEELPQRFVLKCTHDSGGLVICKDKEKFDYTVAKKKINKCLKKNYFWQGREWPYKDIKPRIIAEDYLEDKKTGELRDYKFFAFDGKVKAMFIASERQKPGTDTKFDFYDRDFNHLNIKHGHDNANVQPEKPEQYENMISLAEKLSEGIPQQRIDFYEVDGKIYFGEITFFHHGGLVAFEPEEWDMRFGSWICLPQKKVD